MKRFYFLFAALVALLPFNMKAEDYVVYLNIDNPDAVNVSANYEPVADLHTGINEIQCTDYTTISLSEKNSAEAKIVSVVDKDGNKVTGYYGYYSIYANTSHAGQTWTVTTAPYVQDRSVIVDIDDPTGLSVYMEGASGTITLEPGENEIPYSSVFNTELKIYDYNGSLYQVKVNGKEIELGSDGYWHMTLPAYKIEIRKNYPDVEHNVKFTFVNPGTEGFLTYVKVGEENIAREVYLSDNFVVKAGQAVEFGSAVKDNYTINAVSINGRKEEYFYSYSKFYVKKDSEVTIDVTKLQTMSATVNVSGEVSGVVAKLNYNSYQLQAGANVIEFVDGKNRLTLASSGRGFKVTATQNGDTVSLKNDILLADGDVINVEAAPQVFTDNIVVYANCDVTRFRFHKFSNNAGDDFGVVMGYQYCGLLEGDAPCRVSYWAPEFTSQPNSWFYVNDVEVPYENYDWAFNVVPNDVVKLFYGNVAPAKYTVGFEGETSLCNVKYDLVRNYTDFENGTEHFVGTQFDVTPAADPIEVKVNGVAVPSVDGKHTFTLDANSIVSIAADSSNGVMMVGADKNAAIYNLHGVMVGRDLQTLPAGIYVVGGKKVVKK